ncbi:hypothetical protein F4861DRAFT_88847 [Xylaria intraflava]|nr:hypothetical protein F4861DRAFT_88847 [Xylaria intraflava]
MDGSDEAGALSARNRGNTLYRAGDLIAAESAYIEASRLTPGDPRPLSNISAVKFETGNYIGAALFCESALSLLEKTPDSTLEHKLLLRLAKAYLLAKQYAKATTAISRIAAVEDREQLEKSVASMQASDLLYPEARKLWSTVLERLPRFRPALYNEPEYYTVGHDDAHSVFFHDKNLLSARQNVHSVLYAGIGDGRNLLATISFIGLMAMGNPSVLSKKFHFTLLDIKPTVFARDLLMFRLLLDAADEAKAASTETLAALSYLYTTPVMPPWAYSRIQRAIRNLLKELQNQDADVMGRFYVDTQSRAAISRHLQSWQRKPEGWYSTQEFLDRTRRQLLSTKFRIMATYGSEPGSNNLRTPPVCEAGSPDVRGYEDLGVMLPDMPFLEKHEGQLLKLLKAHAKTRNTANKEKLDQYLYDKWQPNLTLIDFEYQEKRQGVPDPLLDFTPRGIALDLFANIPWEVAGRGARGIFSLLIGFFNFVLDQFQKIRHQTTFDVMIDEMVSFFERAEQGCLKTRERLGSLQPSKFPDRFDHIHMSNIPDYVGGPLTTFIHGLAILRDDKQSTMTSNVLRNTPQWVVHKDFLCEYLLMADRAEITSTFSACLTESSAAEERDLDGKLVGGYGAVMCHPLSWARLSRKPLSWPKLMPRRRVEHWLYSHFLKICLPYSRTGDFDIFIVAPLNLTMMFRITAHLFKVGYPAHWLSDVLTNLATGEITTTARAPRAMISNPTAVTTIHPSRTMSVRPFAIEFRMLLSIWRRLLPFGLPDQGKPENQLPALEKIRQYRVRFEITEQTWEQLAMPSFILVLWNHTVNGQVSAQTSLRALLLDDESIGSKPFLKQMMQKAGHGRPESECTVHVVSTLTWEFETKTASFWFPSNVIESMISGTDDWRVCIWGTQSWVKVLGPLPVNRDTVTEGEFWC